MTKRAEFAIKFGYGESHDVVKTSLDSLNAHVSHPILYAVRTGFVVRGKVLNIVLDFFGAEGVKSDLGFVVESMCMLVVPQANPRKNGMCLIAQSLQHFGGFLGVCRFIQHAVVDVDDGIGGDENFFLDG